MRRILFCAVGITIVFGCKKEEKTIVPKIPVAAEAAASEACYLGISNNDTVSMTLHLKGNEITSGKLQYHLYQKDRNEGELVGLIKGDTLSATYTFGSEGKTTVREVVFLKKGDAYVEGYGEVVDDNNGNISFRDIRTLKFDGKTVLSKVTCH